MALRNAATRITDKEIGFSLEVPAARLRRVVEVYQWVETEKNKHKIYSLKWVEVDIDSSKFHNPMYCNPPRSPNIYSETFEVNEVVNVGQYSLTNEQIQKLRKWEPCKTLPASLDPCKGCMQRARHVLTDSSYTSAIPCLSDSLVHEDCDCLVYNGDISHPVCGTMRVCYEMLPILQDSFISLVGVQENDSFRAFDATDAHRQLSMKKMQKQAHVKKERSLFVSAMYAILCCMTIEDSVLLVEERQTNSDQLFYDEKTKLFKRMSLLRIICCFLLGLGLYLVLNPISYMFFWLPFLQSLIQNLFFFASMIFGFVVGYLIIALAWLHYHPEQLTIILLLLGGYFAASGNTQTAGFVILFFALYPLALTAIHFYEEWRYNCMIEQDKSEDAESHPLLKDHAV